MAADAGAGVGVGVGEAHGHGPGPTLVRVEYAAVSDRGGRPYNQDSFLLLPNPFGGGGAATPTPINTAPPPSSSLAASLHALYALTTPTSPSGPSPVHSPLLARSPSSTSSSAAAAPAAAHAGLASPGPATSAPEPVPPAAPSKPSWLFAVMDGHGQHGREVSQYLRDRLPSVLRAHRHALESRDAATVTSAMHRVFAELQHALAHYSGIDLYMSGSTAALALLFPDHLVAAHVGDSRIVLAHRNTQTAITTHTNNNTSSSSIVSLAAPVPSQAPPGDSAPAPPHLVATPLTRYALSACINTSVFGCIWPLCVCACVDGTGGRGAGTTRGKCRRRPSGRLTAAASKRSTRAVRMLFPPPLSQLRLISTGCRLAQCG
jgi:hypothetical protein